MYVNLAKISGNIARIRACLSHKCKLCAVVKASAYGCGAERVVASIHDSVDMFAVSCVREAAEIRTVKPVLLLAGAHANDECDYAVSHGLIVSVSTKSELLQLKKSSEKFQTMPIVHIKVDTGMNRLGVKTPSELVDLLNCAVHINACIGGIYSHFYSCDSELCELQYACFNCLTERIKNPVLKHIASTGSFENPEYQMDMVRVGLGIYEDATIVFAKVIMTKDMQIGETVSYNALYCAEENTHIAILQMGYADGLKRSLSNCGTFYIGGKSCRIVGAVCMDMCAVICCEDVQVGDTAVFYSDNRQLGLAAEKATTIPYDIMTSISSRVERIYDQD